MNKILAQKAYLINTLKVDVVDSLDGFPEVEEGRNYVSEFSANSRMTTYSDKN